MNLKMNAAMMEIGSLTCTGRLREATALIQRTLHGDSQPIRPVSSNVTEIFSQLCGSRMPHAVPLDFRANEKSPAANGADGTQFRTARYQNSSGAREYKLFVPSCYHDLPLPLIVMLHGGTQDPNDFAAGTRMNAVAEAEGFFVVYPAQPVSANPVKCWNWFRTVDQKRECGEPSLIAGITREVCGKYRVDRRRIHVAGLSAGGAMALTMAINYPELYASVGIHSGLPHAAARDLPSAMAAMRNGPTFAPRAERPIRAIVFHGDRDSTVHPNNGADVLGQCLQGRHDVVSTIESARVPNGNAYTRTVFRDGTGEELAEHWLVHGAGHAWSGGSSRGSYTNPKGPDATKEMLRFFAENPLR